MKNWGEVAGKRKVEVDFNCVTHTHVFFISPCSFAFHLGSKTKSENALTHRSFFAFLVLELVSHTGEATFAQSVCALFSFPGFAKKGPFLIRLDCLDQSSVSVSSII